MKIHQREIQKRGGKCVKYPVSCLIHDMIINAKLQPDKLVLLDVTYGEGRFYGAWRPYLLLASDIAIRQWKIKPDFFTISPSWSVWKTVKKLNIIIDVVVIDPPFGKWRRGGERRNHYVEWYGFGNKEEVLKGGILSAKKLSSRYILVHYDEPVEIDDYQKIAQIEFYPVSRYIYNPDLSHIKTYFMLFKK